jgi:hypothetical protein
VADGGTLAAAGKRVNAYGKLEVAGNLMLADGVTVTVAIGGTLTVASGGALTAAAGTTVIVMGDGTLTVASGGALTMAAGATVNVLDGTLTVASGGAITMENGTMVDAYKSSGGLYVSEGSDAKWGDDEMTPGYYNGKDDYTDVYNIADELKKILDGEDTDNLAEVSDDGKTVTLKKDVELSDILEIPHDMTLDLGGHTLDVTAGLDVHGSGTIFSGSTEGTLNLNNGGLLEVREKGDLGPGVTVNVNSDGMIRLDGGTLNVKGNVTVKSGGKITFGGYGVGTINVNGTITLGSNAEIVVDSYSYDPDSTYTIEIESNAKITGAGNFYNGTTVISGDITTGTYEWTEDITDDVDGWKKQ